MWNFKIPRQNLPPQIYFHYWRYALLLLSVLELQALQHVSIGYINCWIIDVGIDNVGAWLTHTQTHTPKHTSYTHIYKRKRIYIYILL